MAAANVRDGLNADVHATSQLPSVTLDDNTRKSITVASIMASKVKLNVQSFPRPPALQKISRDIRITFRGDTIAQTQDAYWVLETHHPPSGFPVMTPISFGRALLFLQPLMGTAYYLPRTSVKLGLTPTGRRTGCEWKGTATYYEAKLGDGTTVANRIWTYEAPTPAFEPIRGYLSFYAGPPWDCFVDGERVEPQPGDFYGGWVTSDIEGIVKGHTGNLDPVI
ncbi:hypothetical protein Purlil1_3489 [Purpureocillium lilacinum]|uniref:DUF427 domain-containing protein n=1 Tax=Purpureocillium lilacinum TaxID=33203 RepID=A0ABR0C8C8_PURLI|nr:hypothetical protein Purlil1_3489 [Purpureocillium lilacinum]